MPRSRNVGRRPARLAMELLEDRTTPATLPTGFTETAVAAGISGGTAMEFAPNGDLWVLEQSGAIKRFRPGNTTADVVANLSAVGLSAAGERGVLGIAFDPNYAANKWVYVYYTSTDGPSPHNRISRFTVDDGNAADYSFVDTAANPAVYDEADILNLEQLSATNHNGGAIHFGPDGKLYVAVGENAVPANAQSVSNRLGKILRINPDGSIPADNPVTIAGLGATSGANRAIWAAGLRNPYTFTFQPGTGAMYINDVGQNTWEEINVGGAGRNFGWSTTEGDFNQASFPNFTRPLYSYSHGSGTFQGFAITGGAFYSPTTSQFPSEYGGDYFFGDYVNDWINVVNADGSDARRFATGAAGVVDLRVTADGSLYYLARDAGQVFRVTYPTGPEVQVLDGAADVPDGGTADFGSTLPGQPVTRTFIVRNTGTGSLTLGPSVTVPAGFTVTGGFGATTLATGASTTFTVRLDAAAAGSYGGDLSFATNDADENPFNFTLAGTVGVARFDFGTAGSPVAAGYTRVAAGTAYSAAAGYGWQSGQLFDYDRGVGSDLTRDFVYTHDPAGAVFAADVANGTYAVTVRLGDTVYAHDRMGVGFEGGAFDPVDNAAGQVVTRTYTVTVTDGQLNLTLKDLGGTNPDAVLVALDIAPTSPPPPPPPPGTSGAFDFGTAGSPVAAGYTRVAAGTAYSAAAGYGWQSGQLFDYDRGVGSDLTRDFVYTHDPAGAVFAADVANGTYAVTVRLGDTVYAHDRMGVGFEGGAFDPVDNAAGQVVTRTYTVTVTDGQLNLTLKDLGGTNPDAVLVALDFNRIP